MIIFIPKACNFISLDSRVNNEGEGGGGGGERGWERGEAQEQEEWERKRGKNTCSKNPLVFISVAIGSHKFSLAYSQ